MNTNLSSNLFLEKSYQTILEDYMYSKSLPGAVTWDWVFITASNEKQAESYRMQIQERLDCGFLHSKTKYVVLSDPGGKRVGSGGATLNVLRYLSEHSLDSDNGSGSENNSKVSETDAYNIEADANEFFSKKILVIHSGGDSKRIPQYSVCGKLFSPIPRLLPDNRRSVLFDEIIISLSTIPSRINHGMLTISGDVLMLFNPFQVDLKLNKSAVAISIKESVNLGTKHGVYLSDSSNKVAKFLHKQSSDILLNAGAIDEYDNINLDTGAVWFSKNVLTALYSLISVQGKLNDNRFDEMVNDEVRLSYYGDFLFPLATTASFDEYLLSDGEVEINEKLLSCRKKIWNVLGEYNLSLIKMSPARFIHFGTTTELHKMMSNVQKNYGFLGWSRNVLTNIITDRYSISCSYINPTAIIGDNCYIEDCYIGENVTVGENTILSGIKVEDINIPGNIVLHGIKLDNNKYCVRKYGIFDNTKDNDIWTARVFPVCDSMEDALRVTPDVYSLSLETTQNTIHYLTSLEESFKNAEISGVLKWKADLENIIRVQSFILALDKRVDIKKAITLLSDNSVNNVNMEKQIKILSEKAKDYDNDHTLRSRIYLAISYILKSKNICYKNLSYLHFEGYGYSAIKTYILEAFESENIDNINNHDALDRHNVLNSPGSFEASNNSKLSLIKNEVIIKLPVRVNWGGGWSDTVPYSSENGGTVLNAAIKLNGKFPVHVNVKKINKKIIRFISLDLEEAGDISTINELLDLSDTSDPFLIHKGALIVAGVINRNINSLFEFLTDLGGGIEILSNVDIPKGSGLGTSSIFAGACLKAVYEIFGIKYDEQKIYSGVLLLEQLIGTGGGWQDQAGALTNGIKFLKSEPGAIQNINVEHITMLPNALIELKERFVLVYSGQQRFARNILREIMSKYILSDTQTLEVLNEIQEAAKLMKLELEKGSIQGFAILLNMHYELSKKLDKGSSNSSIDLIFELCDDLIDGRFICGAGGGGFLQMILKKGVSKEMLQSRLDKLFHGSGVAVWDCELV